MPRRQIYDQEKHAQFITFSCYRRRRMLDCEPLRDTLLELLAQKLAEYRGICAGLCRHAGSWSTPSFGFKKREN